MTPVSQVDLEGLFCALVLAPHTFSRNRFYGLFEQPEARRIRRRAARMRGILRQLVGDGRPRAEIVGERVLEDGRVLLRYTVKDLNYTRSSALLPLEAATLRFALHRAGIGPLGSEDRDRVERALERLGPELQPREPEIEA